MTLRYKLFKFFNDLMHGLLKYFGVGRMT